MDIRSFFGPKGGSKPPVTKKDSSAKVSNATDKKKRANVISDSDSEEEFVKQPKVSKKVSPSPKKAPAPKPSLPKPKLKEVNASDFFGSSPSNKPTSTTPSVKRKSPEKELERDKAFEDTLKQTPFSPQNKKQRTASPEPPKSISSKLAKFAAEKKTNIVSKSDTKTPDKSAQKLVSSPAPKTSPLNASTASAMDTSLNDSTIPGTPQEDWEVRKAAKTAAYKKFVSRGGAKNPGSKEVPEGSPNCLSGLVFVLTGVYESLEREEMAEIIKKLGGKVTTSLSKNTKYLVVGEEAGESKLAKAKTMGTKQLTEDEFLALLREKTVKEKENKTPKTSPEKVEEKKVEVKPPTPKVAKSLPKVEVKSSTTPKKEPKYEVKPKVNESPKLETKHKIPKIAPEIAKPAIPASSTTYGEGQVDLWVDKYKPANSKAIIGQQGDRSNMNKLKIWLKDWNKNHLNLGGKKGAPKPAPWGAANDNGAWAKCALLSGPPGVGKTTTAYLVSKELGYDVVEMNASDTRSKRMLGENVSDTLNTTSVASMMGKGNENSGVTSKRVLLMDEVDGMAGNEDRGGIAELINLMKSSKVPVIAMCNDRNHQKIRSLANHCFDLRFSRPRVEQIKAAMMSVCFKEKIPIKPEALSELIVGCGQDVRQVLHHLSMVRAGGVEGGGKMEADQAKKEAAMSKKTSIKVGPWDVCKKVFNKEDHKTMSFFDKSDLYFHDYNLAGLFVQENYLQAKPAAANGDKKKLMQLVSKAADSMAEGDLVEKGIRSNMNWGLLPTAAVFCSVVPGDYMSGFLTGQIQFPSWLGKNSKRSKVDRILQELQMHTRLSAGVSKGSLALDYGQVLRNHIIAPLVKEGAEGVDKAVTNMGDYSLLREDLDGLLEVTQWPDKPDPLRSVDSKTKAAFTRKYNKEGVALPYSIATTVSKKKGGGGEDMMMGEEGDEAEEEDDDGDNVEKDASIKMKKAKAPAKKDESGSSKGKGKGSVAGGKGKGKK